MEEYKVFLIKGDSFLVKEAEEHCQLEDVQAMSSTAQPEVVLLFLSKDIPQEDMVPACFQPSDLSKPIVGTELDVLFYSMKSDATFQDGFLVEMFQTPLKVTKIMHSNPRHMTLKGWENAPTGIKAAVGAGAMQRRGDRQFLTAISETLQADQAHPIFNYVWTVDTDDVFNWIKIKAAKNCVCKKPTMELEPKNCDDECKNCGEHQTSASYMIMIVHMDAETTPFTFAAAIGKRFLLTSDQGHWSKDTTKYKVVLMTGQQFRLKEEEKYRQIASLIFKSITGSTSDKIVLIELSDDLPHYMVPACLPSSKLESGIGMEFQVPFYSETKKNPRELENIVTMSQKALGVIVPDQQSGNGRILKLANARIPLSSPDKPALGGPLMQKVDATRDILFGFLEWHILGSMFDFNHRILTVDSKEYQWIDVKVRKRCVCKQPKPKHS